MVDSNETNDFFQFILLSAWSTTATSMAFQRIIIQPIINAVGDIVSAAFLLWIMPIMVFTGILWLSIPTFAMCLCFSIAMYDTNPVPLSKTVANHWFQDTFMAYWPCVNLYDLDSEIISLLGVSRKSVLMLVEKHEQ